MVKIIAAPILSIVALGAVNIERGEHGALIPLAGERGEPLTLIKPLGQRDSFRNLLLRALGTDEVGPDQVRIPIPAESAIYEVIIAKPSLPKYVPVVSKDSD